MKEPQLLITTLRMTTCIVCVIVFLLLHVCFDPCTCINFVDSSITVV